MPSTRKQKAKEKRSRQSDIMSDLDNMNVMLGNYPDNQSDVDLMQMQKLTHGPMGQGPTSSEIARILGRYYLQKTEIDVKRLWKLIDSFLRKYLTK